MEMMLYCCQCKVDVSASLTTGAEIYPHRPDLSNLPFYICRDCNNYVGCHHKTKNRTEPLGCIPTKEIMHYRKIIHSLIDPLWKNDNYRRADIYKDISKTIGYEYHTANIKSVQEALNIIAAIKTLISKQECISWK